jgi:putative flavoprotein involved in K+ transport
MSSTHVPVVVIGAGHVGLAMSRRLTERAIEHVVLDRGTVANSWRTQRWASMRLLTPNWHNQLPGAAPVDGDPDGFLTAGETAAMIDRYARDIAAPIRTGTTVIAVRRRTSADGYVVLTDRGNWSCDAVVLASGASVRASLPQFAAALPSTVESVTALDYQHPGQLPDGAVLVVGASATGVQLAEEIHASGRPVTISIGEHVRMPRTYRGRDVFWWSEAAGVLGERYDEVDDVVRVRHLPSPQLIGTPERRPIDLNSLQDAGIRAVGRLGRIRDGVAQFSGGLDNVCKLADLKLDRLLRRFDALAGTDTDAVDQGERIEPTRTPAAATTEIDLTRQGVRSVVWATGMRPDHRFVELPVFDHAGRIRHDGGVIDDAPGAYVLGLGVLRRRRSSYIAGAESDTADLAVHLHAHLDGVTRRRRTDRNHIGGAGTPSSRWSSIPRSSNAQSEAARPIRETPTGRPVETPNPAGRATTGKPVQSQKWVNEISA